LFRLCLLRLMWCYRWCGSVLLLQALSLTSGQLNGDLVAQSIQLTLSGQRNGLLLGQLRLASLEKLRWNAELTLLSADQQLPELFTELGSIFEA